MNFANYEALAHHWTQNHGPADDHKVYGGNMYTNGAKIYSYGSHYIIAQYVMDLSGVECVIFNSNSYSVTTAGHCSIVRSAVPEYIPSFHAPGADRDAEKGLKHYLSSISELAEKLPRARARAEHYRREIDALKHTAADWARRFLSRALVPVEAAAIATDTDPQESRRLIGEAAAAVEAARIERARKDQAAAVELDNKRARDWWA